MVDKYDLQRIENAIWILNNYRSELNDTKAFAMVGGENVTPWTAINILDDALYYLKDEVE